MKHTSEEQLFNPLLNLGQEPFGAPAFDQIECQHFIPAFRFAIEQHQNELTSISDHSDSPDFENTIAAFDQSGGLLKRIHLVFFSLLEAMSSPEMESIAEQITPILTDHQSRVFQNRALYERIRFLYEKKEELFMDGEERRVLELYYDAFLRAGAELGSLDKARLNEIDQRISDLMLTFSNRVLKETDAYALVITDSSDLTGLPSYLLDAAYEEALQRGLHGQWVFTLHRSSFIPFLQFSTNATLRRELFTAYVSRCDQGNEHDNNAIVNEIVHLRLEKAKLLGYNTYAEFVLEETMAKKTSEVRAFFEKLWLPSLDKAKLDLKTLQDLASNEGQTMNIVPSDWWFYAEKERRNRFKLEQSELMPYFSLENVRDGAFMVANRLFGLQFVKNEEIAVYHPDVEVFEVNDCEGRFLGLFYADYFCRTGKRVGAWMGNFQEACLLEGKAQHPFVYNVCNFVKAPQGKPCLLGLEDVETLFHEFGHALHGLLTKCRYQLVSGTNVPRDFVELPSQLMENWGLHPEVLKMYACHVVSHEPIPDTLIEKIQRSRLHNQGFQLTEYIAAALLDLEWHEIQKNQTCDVAQFESGVLAKYHMLSEIYPRYRSVYFNHIFSNDYAAGYYSYLWAEVFDADVFDSFLQTSVFDSKNAELLKKEIFEKGNAEDPMSSFLKFKGRELSFDAFLKRRGLAFF